MLEPSAGVVGGDAGEGVRKGGVERLNGFRRDVSQLAFELRPRGFDRVHGGRVGGQVVVGKVVHGNERLGA